MKKVTVYSGSPCSYCEAAKALLKSKNIAFEEDHRRSYSIFSSSKARQKTPT